LAPGLPSVRAAKGSILFLNVPIESTFEHVMETLPSDKNMNFIVEGTSSHRFSKGIICSLEKVN